ncbi:uncharacterized protein LOC141684940 [Apium graveolens]|uniref:uncharacterized protein LOC141684940 n=1 Tax=Apium graveolens TaxID=4045 RepID=UPI003D7A49E2
MRIVEVGDNTMYLGFPNMLGRNKNSLLNFLKSKVEARIQCWDGSVITQGGKEVLIKSVAQTLPSYAMSVFLLPMEVSKDIERSFLESTRGNNSSYIWRSIWESRYVLRAGLRWVIGSENDISILGQPWVGDDVNPYVLTDPMHLTNYPIANLFECNKREWDVEVVKDMFDSRDQGGILNTKIGGADIHDHLYWCKENLGIYSVRSVYRLLQFQKGLWNVQDNNSLWRKIW